MLFRSYTVKEDKVANYDTDITGNAKDGFKIKNSNNEKVKVPVEKTWVGPKQKSVTVRLFADGVEKQHVELSAANNWKHEFTNLPKYNDNGTLIKYTVKEDKIAGYNTEITGDTNNGYKIKNAFSQDGKFIYCAQFEDSAGGHASAPLSDFKRVSILRNLAAQDHL